VGEKRHFARKFFSNPFSAAQKSGSSGRKSHIALGFTKFGTITKPGAQLSPHPFPKFDGEM
jgi:hypothetical protein